MDKKTTTLIIDVILIGIFNAIFFLWGGTDHNETVWLAYAFIHIAFVAAVGTSLVDSLASIKEHSLIYFILSFIVGIFFMIFSMITIKFVITIYIILTGFYLVFCLAAMSKGDNQNNN